MTDRAEFSPGQMVFLKSNIREDLVLKPIASAKELTPHLSRSLEKARDAPPDDSGNQATPVWDTLDAQHHALWSEARAQHQQHAQELMAYRRESLSTSYIETAEADYERRIQELDRAMGRADIIAEPVAYGVLRIGD